MLALSQPPPSPLFIQSGTSAHGIALPTFRAGLPPPAFHLWENLQERMQRQALLTSALRVS